MSSEKEPFHERDYEKENEHYCPYLKLLISEKKTEIRGYADTGCGAGISLFKDDAEKLGLELGDKINTEPVEISVADGHLVGGDIYITTFNIYEEDKEEKQGKEDKEFVICVVDPKIIGYKPEKVPPLIGRNFLDKFDVLFKGEERKIVLLK